MTLFRNIMTTGSFIMLLIITACSDDAAPKNEPDDPTDPITTEDLAEQNLLRAMQITDVAITAHFTGDGMIMARYYNPYTDVRSDEKNSIWEYTTALEAVNAILLALDAQKAQGSTTLYDEHFDRYATLLNNLYENAAYYLGTFTLTSYTQTQAWTVYGVDRGGSKGTAQVDGIHNVYDDQMWFIRELLQGYKTTGNTTYLEEAEYLTAYVLDGWDCTLDDQGDEMGGITWGPGYVTKHSCSNGPLISSLVWLSELYDGQSDEITRHYIDPTDLQTRLTESVNKSDYYLDFAKKIYAWQRTHLIRTDQVYNDLLGNCAPGQPQTEEVNGVTYRKGINCLSPAGPAISYNSGSMLSGGADLYRVTQDNVYLEDIRSLSDASFQAFAMLDLTNEGYYSYDISGFNNWFNDVLMRGYVDVYPTYTTAADYINTFQQNLDYGYSHFLYKGFLPTNLLVGWSLDTGKNNTEGMFSFSFAAEYAVLARYELEK